MHGIRIARTLGLAIALSLVITAQSWAQDDDEPEAKASPAAKVSLTIGIDTEIAITYHSPGVKGREVWGTRLAAYDRPWRAGANNTTQVSFSSDVKLNGKVVPAGTYGLHIIPTKSGKWTLIFNKVYETWGTQAPDKANDALRLEVDAKDAPHQEHLVYGFDSMSPDEGPTSANGFMHWEKKKVSFKIETTD